MCWRMDGRPDTTLRTQWRACDILHHCSLLTPRKKGEKLSNYFINVSLPLSSYKVMYGTLCNLLMVLEMSREQARKSLSPSVPWALAAIRSGPGDPLFISSVEWDDSRRGEYFYCSVWLHLGGASERSQMITIAQHLSRTSCCTQLNWKESLTLKAVCHSNFQIGRVSNLECY